MPLRPPVYCNSNVIYSLGHVVFRVCFCVFRVIRLRNNTDNNENNNTASEVVKQCRHVIVMVFTII